MSDDTNVRILCGSLDSNSFINVTPVQLTSGKLIIQGLDSLGRGGAVQHRGVLGHLGQGGEGGGDWSKESGGQGVCTS